MIGQLRHRIKIQTKSSSTSYKGVDETWSDTETRWGRAVRLNQIERKLYEQFGTPDRLIKFIFKGDVTLKIKDNRFVYNSNTYEMLESKRDAEQVGKYLTVVARKLVRS